MSQTCIKTILFLMLVVGSGAYFPALMANPSTVDQPTLQELDRTLRTAGQLRSQVQALGFEWTTIGPLLNSAHQLRDQGNLIGAMRAASEALLHCQLALEQAHYAQTHWQLALP